MLPASPVLALIAGLAHAWDHPQDWTLVAAYDLAALAAADPENAPRTDFVWRPATGMESACGPVKMPQGMGVMEAEAIGSGLTPTLAILLARPEETPASGPPRPLRAEEVQLALAKGAIREPLMPVVMPRFLTVKIEGDAPRRFQQLVRTQLAMETCMEHKVGRAWMGSEERLVRQAFLLEPPGAVGDRSIDRMYFGGQWAPVNALLGPPAACEKVAQRVQEPVDLTPGAEAVVEEQPPKGEGSAQLVPTDVWGATLRECNDAATTMAGQGPDAYAVLPLTLAAVNGEDPGPRLQIQATEMVVSIQKDPSGAVVPEDAPPLDTVEVTLGGEVVLPRERLFKPITSPDGQQLTGLTDILAFVPYELPSIGPAGDPYRYTIILVPNWQITDRLRHMARAAPNNEELQAASRADNGVAWLLAHPEYLVLQVDRPTSDALSPTFADRAVNGLRSLSAWMEDKEEEGSGRKLPDLSAVLGSGGWDIQAWGYIAGQRYAHTPIVLPTKAEPSRMQGLSAHRAWSHGGFLFFSLIGIGLSLIGFRRLPDLWTPIPEERAAYWPGRRQDQAGPSLGSSNAVKDGGG